MDIPRPVFIIAPGLYSKVSSFAEPFPFLPDSSDPLESRSILLPASSIKVIVPTPFVTVIRAVYLPLLSSGRSLKTDFEATSPPLRERDVTADTKLPPL